MAQNDIFRVALRGLGPQGQVLVNVFHYRQEGDLILDEPGEDFVQAWQDEVQAFFLGCISQACQIDRIEVRGVTNPLYGFDFDYSPPVLGGQSGDACPPQTACLISWRTGLVGRARRGRTYMWPPSESTQAGGAINATQIANLEGFITAAIALPTTLEHTGWQMMIHSETAAGNNPVTQGIVRPIMATQKRRRLGAGT